MHWFKLNSDDARHKINGLASCGGIIRDSMGQWVHSFTKFIDICSVDEAELWRLFVGLTCARNIGLNQVIVECDSMEALRLVQQRISCSGWKLILAHIEELLHQNWVVEFRFIHREENVLVYAMAKLA
ncbi:hypothetical protein V6N13_143605 [Hibiscus sabdariffa]|uniref:RNase H type-1 domain-containing protein n=1 Tax=Hibiscus sabdariffa TaxID=183260 RepID=A0ABR2FIG7_9ROSI